MATGHSDDGPDKDDANESDGVDRRAYLGLFGAAAASAGVAGVGSTNVSAATTRHGISFDNVVNIVEDHGADPTGNDPVDAALDAAAGANTLVKFPEGTYKFTQRHAFQSGSVGLLGVGDVSFTFPQGFNEYFLIWQSDQALFENIDIDHRQSNTVAGMKILTQHGFHVQDVEFLGRGTHSDRLVTNAFIVHVGDAGSTGIIKNVTAKKGSSWSHYKSGGGREGCHIGPGNAGTVRLVNVHFEEFGNNGIYSSASGGPVQVEDSLFRNNNVAAMRIGGEGSHVKNTVIENSEAKYTGPRTASREDHAFNLRGMVVEQKKAASTDRDSGLLIEDVDIVIHDDVPRTGAGLHVWRDGGGFTARNTRIQVDRNGTPNILAQTPDGGPHEVPPKPHRIRLGSGVSLTGSANNSAAVVVQNRDNSAFENACIQQSGSDRDGIRLVDSDNSVVQDSNLNVSGQAIDLRQTNADVSNITHGDTCPAPSLDGASDSTSDGDTTDGNTTDGSTSTPTPTPTATPEPSLPNTVTIESTGGGLAEYEFTVSEQLRMGPDAEDTVDGATAYGRVGPDSGTDDYEFSGEITDFTLDGPANVTVNGDPLDLSQFGETSSGSSLSRTVEVRSTATERATYEFTVSEALEAGPNANLSGVTYTDSVEGTTASGSVLKGGADDYNFAGEVTDLTVDGPAEVYVDGQQVDPADFGQSLPNSIEIRSNADERATYEFTVTEDLQPGPNANLDNATYPDSIEGTTASGSVLGGGHDNYTFAGEIVAFTLDGPATVYVDGQQVDPASLGLPNRIVLDGTNADGQSEYQFKVTGEVRNDPSLGAVESGDEVASGAVTGVVEDDVDGFRFAGDLSAFRLDGDAAVEFADNDG